MSKEAPSQNPEEVFKKFCAIFFQSNFPSKLHSEKIEDFDSELKLLKPHLKPVIWGIGTTMALFASFRVNRHTGQLFTLTRRFTFERVPRQKLKNELQKRQKMREDLFSIPLDIICSFAVGCSTAIFLTDAEKMYQDLAKLPLVKGRSSFSDDLCTDFIRQYHQVPRDFWTSRVDEKGGRVIDEHGSLRMLQQIALNCEKRQFVENYMKKEKGDSTNDPIYIPYSVPMMIKRIPSLDRKSDR